MDIDVAIGRSGIDVVDIAKAVINGFQVGNAGRGN
jgi:hypothetical protein